MKPISNTITILGNKVDCFRNFRDLYDTVVQELRSARPGAGYVTVNNVHTMIEGYRDASYQAIINQGFLSIPDGKPLEFVGRLKGNKIISRLFGPSLMEHVIDWGRQDRISHFFLGSSEATLLKLQKAINAKYPGTIIAGMVSPPYRPIEEWNHEELIRRINVAKPDIVWIGLGAPKQEKWMSSNYGKIEKGLLFGIGAGFDYMAGNTRHAPRWMKALALEWLYRLLQEPGRLWKRYFKTIPQFLVFATLDILRTYVGRRHSPQGLSKESA